MAKIANEKPIILGSGELYVTEYTGVIPADNLIEIETNKLGQITGGATVVYKPEFHESKDDLGVIKEMTLIEEKASFKSGLMVPSMAFAQKTTPTVKVTEGTSGASHTPTVTKIGGIKNANGKKYIVRFVHISPADPNYKLRVTIVGINVSGFDLGFLKDKDTIADVEFSATPMDTTGTLVRFDEPVTA